MGIICQQCYTGGIELTYYRHISGKVQEYKKGTPHLPQGVPFIIVGWNKSLQSII